MCLAISQRSNEKALGWGGKCALSPAEGGVRPAAGTIDTCHNVTHPRRMLLAGRPHATGAPTSAGSTARHRHTGGLPAGDLVTAPHRATWRAVTEAVTATGTPDSPATLALTVLGPTTATATAATDWHRNGLAAGVAAAAAAVAEVAAAAAAAAARVAVVAAAGVAVAVAAVAVAAAGAQLRHRSCLQDGAAGAGAETAAGAAAAAVRDAPRRQAEAGGGRERSRRGGAGHPARCAPRMLVALREGYTTGCP
jgi:hypothetical protein